MIRLENATHIIKTESRPKKAFVFEIPTPDRTYFLSADSEEERNDWIRLCTAAKQAEIEKYNPGKGKKTAGGAGGGGKSGGGGGSQKDDFGEDDSHRVGVEDFDLLTVIGKGSFGKVLQVRKKDTGKIYAMKVLNKATIIARDEVSRALPVCCVVLLALITLTQMEHTKSEKSILQKLQSPFLVCLHFTFQTSDKLYFIMDYMYGGGVCLRNSARVR